jgi:response regulator NasT
MADETFKVLLADEEKEELRHLAQLVEAAGHDVVALAITAAGTGDAIVEHRPDMAMILVHGDEQHAVELMVEIRSFAEIPLVVLARSIGDELLRSAADHALEVLHLPDQAETVNRVIQLAAERHREQQRMLHKIGEIDGILQRRSTIEQAKGILMERHGIDDVQAFTQIRDLARNNQLKVVDVATSIVTARELLSVDSVEQN